MATPTHTLLKDTDSLLSAIRRDSEHVVSVPVMVGGQDRILGILSTPRQGTDTMVVIAAGLLTLVERHAVLTECASRMAEQGHAVLRFNFRGVGAGETGQDTSITSQISDFQDVLRYAKSEGYKNIIVIAHCLGAGISVLSSYGSVNVMARDVKAMALLSPTFNLGTLFQRYKDRMADGGVELTREGWKPKLGDRMFGEFGLYSPAGSIGSIRSPTLIVYGTKDHLVSRSDIDEDFAKFGCVKHLEVVEGAMHDFRDNAGVVASLVDRWVRTQLKPEAKTEALPA